MLPSLRLHHGGNPSDYQLSTLRVFKILAAKVAECRLNPESMPSERLLRELKKAMNDNDELWHSGRFHREDDPSWYACCHENHGVDIESEEDEESEEQDLPVVSSIGKWILLAVRSELDQWEQTHQMLKDESDSYIQEWKGRGR
jgi:hypothetical protein